MARSTVKTMKGLDECLPGSPHPKGPMTVKPPAISVGGMPFALLLALSTIRCGSSVVVERALDNGTQEDASTRIEPNEPSELADAAAVEADGDAGALVDAASDSPPAPVTDCITFGHVLVGGTARPEGTLACTKGTANPSAGIYPCCAGLTCDSSYGSPLCVALRGETCAADAGHFPLCSKRDTCDPESLRCEELTCAPIQRNCAELRLPCCAPGAECKIVGSGGIHECCLPAGAFLSTEPASRGVECCSRSVIDLGTRRQCL